MNVKHLRAKYQIEQYPVVFTFPEQVLYEPRVRVEVVSGVDPAPETFAGLPIVDGNLVAVLVAGGVPGVIYRIICAAELADGIVELEGLLAVKDTAADTPEGTSALPLTLTVTTPPYPAYVVDSFGLEFIPKPGLLMDWPFDEFDLQFVPLDGIFRDLIGRYNIPPEELDLSFLPLDGVLRALIAQYVCPPESLDITFIPKDGTLRNILIVYANNPPGELDISFLPLDGVYGSI